MSHKTCRKCGETFPLTEQFFQKRKDSKDGYRSECKDCKKSYLSKYRQDNHKKILEMNKRYNDINKEKRLEYKDENRDRLNQYDRMYRKNNPEKELAFRKKYREEHPELYRIARMKYRSRKNELPQTLTVEEWGICLNHFNDSCAYCGKHQSELEHKIEQDHFIPVTKRGGYTVDNMIPACRSCNASKLNNDFETWYQSQPFYDEDAKNKIINYINSVKELLA